MSIETSELVEDNPQQENALSSEIIMYYNNIQRNNT